MTDIKEVVDSIKDDALKAVKDQLADLLNSAENDTNDVIRGIGKKVGNWLLMRARGELSDSELEALLYSSDQTLRQYKNTINIEVRARCEKIAVALVNLVLDKIVGIATHAP